MEFLALPFHAFRAMSNISFRPVPFMTARRFPNHRVFCTLPHGVFLDAMTVANRERKDPPRMFSILIEEGIAHRTARQLREARRQKPLLPVMTAPPAVTAPPA